MKQRIRDYLDETHGARFELLRHFLARFLDSDLFSNQGEWSRVAVAVVAILASLAIPLGATLNSKYSALAISGLQHRIPAEVQSDLLTLVALVVAATMLLAAALWESLYPSRHDYLALAALPIRPVEIFAAKFWALLLVFLVFEVLLIGPTSIVFCLLTGGHAAFISTLLAMAGASVAVFFGIVGLQGLLLNFLPRSLFERLSVWFQAMLVGAALAGLFLFPGMRVPPVAALLAPATAVLIYWGSFARHRSLLLEMPQLRGRRRRDVLDRLIDLWIKDPREQAASLFFLKTLGRSRVHRFALLVFVALAAAWIAANLGGASPSRLFLTSAPLMVAVFSLLGLRYLYALPTDLRSNWMFQLTEREGRLAWLRAVERLTLWCGLFPILMVGAVAIAFSEGLLIAAAWGVLAGFATLMLFEWFFRDWQKLPFTCSYLPGKRPLYSTVALCVALALALVPIGLILVAAASNAASWLVFLVVESLIWWRLRWSRISHWGVTPLRYEELPPGSIDSFPISGERATTAREAFARAWHDRVRSDPSIPIVSPLGSNETRFKRLAEWLRAAPRDLRYAARVLRRSPTFALAAILTLGLGLGLNAAFFTVFNAFVLTPLAVHDPHSLVSVDFRTADDRRVFLAASEAAELAEDPPALAGILTVGRFVAGLDGKPARGALVSGNYFSLLGVSMALGRPVESDDGPVLVLADSTWRERFGADEGILGRELPVDGQPFVVIGVAPGEFAGLELGGIDFWAPVDVWSTLPGLRRPPAHIIGRLGPGVSEERAAAALTTYGHRLNSGRDRDRRIARAVVEEKAVPVTRKAFRYFLPLLLAFVLTMAIPCANTANMMLARAMTRQRELGVRLSLGATRGRVVRQLLAEGLLISLFAGFAGLAVARLALDLAVRLIYETAPPTTLFLFRIPELAVDIRVFCYMLAAAALTTALFALAPAAQATRAAVSVSIRGEFGPVRSSRLRDALVVGQVAVCTMLLVAAGLLLRSNSKLAAVDLGYDAQGVYAVTYNTTENALLLRSDLEREPWVETMAFVRGGPSESGTTRVATPSHPDLETVYHQEVSPEYFRLLRIPVVRGRTFTQSEALRDAPVAMVTETLAGQLWPGQEPIGKALNIHSAGAERERQVAVVGVTGDVVGNVVSGHGRGMVYFPSTLRADNVMFVSVRGLGSPDETRRLLEQVLARRSNQGERVAALQETVDWATYPQRVASWLSLLLGGVALLLTVTGIYGVMSYLVTQRTKEIGVRIALGATGTQVAGFTLAYNARLTAVGLCFGAILALGVSQYSAATIGAAVDFHDPAAYALSLALVALFALLAALGPARRASRLDPMSILRAE